MKNKIMFGFIGMLCVLQILPVSAEELSDGSDANLSAYEAVIPQTSEEGSEQMSAVLSIEEPEQSYEEEGFSEETLDWEEKADLLGDGSYEDIITLVQEAKIKLDTAASGTCGTNLKWNFSNGVLTVSGTGAMTDYVFGDGGEFDEDMKEMKYSTSPFERLNIKRLVIENGVTRIGNNAFNLCTTLTSVQLPGSVSTIGTSAFSGCTGLKTITFGSGLRSIEEGAFEGCESLTSINLPPTLVTIGKAAFFFCENLQTVSMQGGITTISDWTFYGCDQLSQVNYAGTDAEWKKISIGENNDSLLNASIKTAGVQTISMHRVYNPYSGEHLYTSDTDEWQHLVSLGWQYEGIAWHAPKKSSTPVYRLYNPDKKSGEHHYTVDAHERSVLLSQGWRDEGIGWYSDDNKSVPIYRLFNIRASSPVSSHHYTADTYERSVLLSQGWSDEKIGWYAVK